MFKLFVLFPKRALVCIRHEKNYYTCLRLLELKKNSFLYEFLLFLDGSTYTRNQNKRMTINNKKNIEGTGKKFELWNLPKNLSYYTISREISNVLCFGMVLYPEKYFHYIICRRFKHFKAEN